jgi:hypothetical protein
MPGQEQLTALCGLGRLQGGARLINVNWAPNDREGDKLLYRC